MNFAKMTALLTACVALNVQAAPILRIFDITADPAQTARFNQVGEYNLTKSVREEADTLAMYATHKTDDVSQNVVLEIYADENAYEIHRNSEQYQAYAAMAKDVVKGFKRTETDVQFLAEKPSALAITASKNSNVHIRLTSVTVQPEHNAKFRKIVIDEMKKSMAKEAGVLVMYAATVKDMPNEWRFFEIYADEQAYLNHRETKNFKHYLQKTEKMVQAKSGVVLAPDTLMNKGGLRFDVERK